MRLDLDWYRSPRSKHKRVQLVPRRKAADKTPADIDENRAMKKTGHMSLCRAFVGKHSALGRGVCSVAAG
jgi:hypothetical protein